MPRKRSKVREERITMEIIVDAYDSEEQAMGWYYYLDRDAEFPFSGQVHRRPERPRPCAKGVRFRSSVWLPEG